jgi:hypothetical protein
MNLSRTLHTAGHSTPARSGSLEVAHFRNREAMAALSRGRKPTEKSAKQTGSREAAAADFARTPAAAPSGLIPFIGGSDLRADARSYPLPPLRGSGGATSKRSREGSSRTVLSPLPLGERVRVRGIGNLRLSLFSLFVLLLLLFATAWTSTASAQAVDAESLKRRQENQQRARKIASELVDSILRVQIRQLEENGLQEMQIYRDIKTMQANIGELVKTEMAQVVDLLVEAQEAQSETVRQQKFIEARKLIRQIIVQLAVERQKLLRRLKTAEIAEQVRRLIRLETAAMGTTKGLPAQTPTRREQLALKTIEDQRDINKLFLQLLETLSDVSRWDGAIATGAANGIRILAAAETGKHLDEAVRNLAATEYTSAVIHQDKAIQGLSQLLKLIERTQGLIGAERQAALDKIHALSERQRELREKTKTTKLTDPPQRELIDEQNAIRKALGDLAEELSDQPRAQTHLDQAKSAASQATTEIFDGEKDQAVSEQSKVLGHLAALAEELESMSEADNSDRSADEYARQVKDLEAAKKDVNEAKSQQETAQQKTAESKPQEAVGPQNQVANKTEAAAKDRDLPESVKSRLAEAQEAAEAAAKALKTSDKQEAQEEAVEKAAEALERAAAEIEAALADAKRREAAVKIGELARAAETLERAAATEREIAEATGQAAKEEGLKPKEAKHLSEQQEDVNQIAKKIAEGVENTSPKAGEILREAMKETAAAAGALNAAKNAPGEPSKPSAEKASQNADAAAEKLTQAAARIRQDIGETATNLADLSEEQLQQINEAQTAVDEVQSELPESIAERLQELKNAQEKVADAAALQQKAAGRPEAAEAMTLAQKVAQAAERQVAADQAANDLAEGRANTPLDATAKQQEVADLAKDAKEVAAKRPEANKKSNPTPHDELVQSLDQAQKAAAEAARQTLDGNTNQAETARQAARQALKKAGEQAQAEAQAAAGAAPTRNPDAEAQAQVAQTAKQAGEAAMRDALAAANTLEEAAQNAEAAAGAVKNENEKAARTAQSETAEGLQKAGEQIAEAIKELAQQEAEQLAQQAAKTGELAAKTAQVDPGATAALRQAQKAAQATAALGEQTSPAQAAQAEEAVQNNLQRAAANLAVKEQQVRKDQAIAAGLAELARRQQQAAEQIAQQRNRLEGQQVNDAPMSDAQKQQAAQALAESTKTFADAQRATGEGASEIANQREVANVPIREALQLASNLQQPRAGQPTQPGEAKAPEAQPGQPAEAQPGQPGEPTKPSQPGEAQPGQPGEGQHGQQGQPGEGQPGQAQTGPGQPMNAALGTGFVPNSPEVTAQMMAGPEAAALAASALASALENPGQTPDAFPGQPGQAQPAQGQPGQGQTPTPSQIGASSPTAQGGGTSKGGNLAQNDGLKDGPLEFIPTDGSAGDSRTPNAGERQDETSPRNDRRDAWFAKLPPNLRNAIRANAQQEAPRAYRERLKRYFESIE